MFVIRTFLEQFQVCVHHRHREKGVSGWLLRAKKCIREGYLEKVQFERQFEELILWALSVERQRQKQKDPCSLQQEKLQQNSWNQRALWCLEDSASVGVGWDKAVGFEKGWKESKCNELWTTFWGCCTQTSFLKNQWLFSFGKLLRI